MSEGVMAASGEKAGMAHKSCEMKARVARKQRRRASALVATANRRKQAK